jgi:acetylornithine deacetylase/succinyl-diaminopimelate desuccinylase-like protein
VSRVRRPVLFLLAAAALIAGIAIWIGKKPSPKAAIELDQIRSPEEWLTREPVRLLRDYVRIETTEEKGELAGAEFLRHILECDGIETEIVCPAPRRCNLLARLPGKTREGGLLLLNHIDVFPYQAQFWKDAPPFEGAIKSGFLYGRGAYDMKSIAIAQALAMRQVKRLGIVPESDILFLAEADEELGQKWGARWLLDNRPEWFAGVRYVLNEGGFNEMILRQVRFFGVETLQSGTAWAEFQAGEERPLKELADRWRKLEGGRVPPHPQIRAAFDLLANHMAHPLNELLRNLDEVRNDPARMAQLGDRYGSFLEPRIFWSPIYPFPFVVGKDRRIVCVIATPPGVSPQPYFDGIVADAKKAKLELIRTFVSEATEASPFLDKDGMLTPLLALIRDTLEARYPGVPFGPVPISGVYTSSVLFRRRGFEAYGWTPIAVNITDAARLHGNDERIFLADYVTGVEMYQDVVLAFALGLGREVSTSTPQR